MKNVHLIPTDKPSRLTIRLKTNELIYSYKEFVNQKYEDISLNQNQHIYITNDEEIKEGDWFYDEDEDEILKAGKNVDLHLVNNLKPNFKKIILTTDPDLIADGVQAIDDEFEFEFLEWFVKNPSCEFVEVEKDEFYSKKAFIEGKDAITFDYKIIIPQEEPKQDYSGVHFKHCYQGEYEDGCKYGEDDCPAKPRPFVNTMPMFYIVKQETLEEAANECALEESKFGLDKVRARINFIKGAKWQQERSQTVVPFDATEIEVFAIKPDDTGSLKAFIGYKVPNGNFMFSSVPFTEPQSERMYSEEDMKKAFSAGEDSKEDDINGDGETPFEQWFEQFKKK